MKLKIKFTSAIFLLLAFIILTISLSLFIAQKKILRKYLESSRQKIFQDFTSTCTESLVLKDEILIFNTIKSLTETYQPTIVYAGYLSPSGIVLSAVKKSEEQNAFRQRFFKIDKRSINIENFFSKSNEEIKEFGLNLFVKDKYVGTIKVGFSEDNLILEIKKGINLIFNKIFAISVFALLIGFILAFALAEQLNRPIKKLTEASIELSKGNLNVKVEIENRKDELGQLSHTFNEMVKKIRELDELKDSFVSSVSHELRSPLSAIDGYCDYLIEGILKNMPIEKQQKALRIMKEATIRLTDFINSILDIAKIKAGKFEIKKVAVNINYLCKEIVTLFTQLATDQGKRLKLDVPENIPNVNADPEKIKQVITNLLGNALKFTPVDSEIIVGAQVVMGKDVRYGKRMTDSLTDLQKNIQFVEIWVSDTGLGIPPDEIDKIFLKFYQVSESATKKPKGTGLGLSIAAEIVKLHDGKIWVESVLGKSSTFRFILPLT